MRAFSLLPKDFNELYKTAKSPTHVIATLKYKKLIGASLSEPHTGGSQWTVVRWSRFRKFTNEYGKPHTVSSRSTVVRWSRSRKFTQRTRKGLVQHVACSAQYESLRNEHGKDWSCSAQYGEQS